MEPAKKWWKSKTLWFNLASAVFAALEASVGLLQPMIGHQAYVALFAVNAFGNTVLRLVTSQGLSR